MVKFFNILNIFFLFSLVLYQVQSANIIVIGAGVSGLISAERLTEKGHNVKILEASNRIGGRVATDFEHFGYPVEKGAIWIDDTDPGNPIMNLFKKYKLNLINVSDNNTIYFTPEGKNLGRIPIQLTRITAKYKQFIVNQPKLINKPLFFTVREFILKTKPSKLDRILITYIVTSYFSINDKRKLKDVIYHIMKPDDYKFSNKLYMTPDGYVNAYKPMARKLNIQFNTEVKQIKQNDKEITVVDSKGKEYTADYVVITVPLGYLKKNLIKFTPGLSEEKLEAIEKIPFYNMNKVFVEFEEKFWGDEHVDTYLSDPIEALEYSVNYHRVNGKNLLIFFVGESLYHTIENKTDEELSDMVIRLLKPSYPTTEIKIKKLLITRWNQDPYTYGAFTGFDTSKGLINKFNAPEGRLIFAGEHTDIKFNACVRGAWNSGERAAKQIEYLINNIQNN